LHITKTEYYTFTDNSVICQKITEFSVGCYLKREFWLFEKGVLLFEKGILPFEKGVLPFEKGVLPFEKGILPFEKGVLLFQKGVFLFEKWTKVRKNNFVLEWIDIPDIRYTGICLDTGIGDMTI
jgi:hypothetical protein